MMTCFPSMRIQGFALSNDSGNNNLKNYGGILRIFLSFSDEIGGRLFVRFYVLPFLANFFMTDDVASRHVSS